MIPTDLYDKLEPLFVKSHFVTGLSQIDNLDNLGKLILQDERDLEFTGHTRLENTKGFHAFPKHSVFPTSPLKSLIMSLRVKYEQRRNIEKMNNSELKTADIEELKVMLDDQEKRLLDHLASNLQENNLDSVAKLLAE